MTDQAPTRGVPVQLDEVHYLRYPMSAIKAIQTRFDINLVQGAGFEAQSLDDVIWVIYLGLEHENPPIESWWHKALAALGIRRGKVTEQWVADQIDMQNLAEITRAMQMAMGGQAEDLEAIAAEMEEAGKARSKEQTSEAATVR